MKRIMVTGALGQIGSDLVAKLRQVYGEEAVLATDIRQIHHETVQSGPFRILDVTDHQAFHEATKEHRADTIIHLAPCCPPRRNPIPHWRGT